MIPSTFSRKTIAASSIAKTFRYIDWAILATTFLFRLFIFLRFINIFNSTILLGVCIELFLLTSYTFLSFSFPVSRSNWQRRAYLLVDTLIVLSLQSMNVSYDYLLYLVYAKTCFLLNRKGVTFTLSVTGIAWIIIRVWRTQIVLNEIYNNDKYKLAATTLEPIGFIIDNICNPVFIHFTISIFVILLSFFIVEEQKSRQRAEALAQEVETLAATLERTRIAREIHDSLGHTLTTLNVQLELAQALCDRNTDQTRQFLDKAKQLASQGLKDVRQALQTLRQQNRNLHEELNNLIAEFKQVTSATSQSIAISSTINLPPLPLQTEHQLYSIVKEGLTNIQKHAQASRVILKASVTANRITLELADDGKGFNSQTPHSGFGLRGMQERVELLGGQFQIHSTLNRGTLIQVAIPYDSTASS
jgi:signal transduction histidine kinase